MGVISFGKEVNKANYQTIRGSSNVYHDVSTAYVSSNKYSSVKGDYGLVVVPATASGLVCGASPLPVKLSNAEVNLTGDVNVDVAAFVDHNKVDIDGAVTHYENQYAPSGPSILAIVAKEVTSKSGQYLRTHGTDLLTYDKGVSGNTATIKSDTIIIKNNIMGISGNMAPYTQMIASGRETLVAAKVNYINSYASQPCRNISLSCPSGFYLMKSGTAAGCLYQANVVYDVPIQNTNAVWISGLANTLFHWTAWS